MCKVNRLYTLFFQKGSEVKKNLQISELNDVYGALLTEHQHDVLTNYYDYDLSLAEIAENDGVSRQAVRDAIVKAEEQLTVFEEKLGLLEKSERDREEANVALKALCEGNTEPAKVFLTRIAAEAMSRS